MGDCASVPVTGRYEKPLGREHNKLQEQDTQYQKVSILLSLLQNYISTMYYSSYSFAGKLVSWKHITLPYFCVDSQVMTS